MTTKAQDDYVRCSPLETASGWVYGRTTPPPLSATRRTPREALDDAIRPALLDGPCYVTFSGGRDSSAVLAAATALARREGHPLPIPVTRCYPDIPATDESAWQRMVVDHLGLTEWIRFELREDESDLLGDTARAGLRARGLLWPAPLQTHGFVFERLRGGSLLTGEGGDAVFGARRITPLTVLRRHGKPSRALVAAALTTTLPASLRRRQAVRGARTSAQSRWLTPAALERHARLVVDDLAREPLRYDEATWAIAGWRSFATVRHNHTRAAAEFDIDAHDPLLDAGFLAALARAGGIAGFNGRTSVMRALFSDVLPAALIARPTKAAFNLANRGEATTEFARGWDGSGVDHDLVDAERLREVWLSDRPTMASGLLLQQAWLASEGLLP
ncbi:asparagine synthase-related protein [Nocardioides sp. YIM 152315]|uniref:asparagine synthase-related protein n=1 Tax=Nocardioides sp. YIM 152315 TaxID=3031760 RepID=UPI0023DAA0BE|nr:asparagine synthase-related protein [Nocardioides sp. YIM 152315]MDF1603438.1 asparagine synthase-related protein [Nocardioides sp. YIM 152315]